jgi:hypothetical protein
MFGGYSIKSERIDSFTVDSRIGTAILGDFEWQRLNPRYEQNVENLDIDLNKNFEAYEVSLF